MEEPDKKIEYIQENLDEMHIYLENTSYQEEIGNPNSLIKKTPGPEVFCLFVCLLFGHNSWHAELPNQGWNPCSPAMEVLNLNHWTTREVPMSRSFISEFYQTFKGANNSNLT